MARARPFSLVLDFSFIYPPARCDLMTVYFMGAMLFAAAGIGLWRSSRRRQRALKVVIRIGALVIASFSPLLLLGFLMTGLICGRYDFPEVHAPNGAWAAAVSEEDCGATDSFHSSVEIWRLKHEFLNPLGRHVLASRVFTIGHDPRFLQLAWKGPNVLVIRYPADSREPDEFSCRPRWKDIQVQCISYSPSYREPVAEMPPVKRWFH